MELPQLLLVRRGTPLELPQQRGVGHRPPPRHHPVHLGEYGGKSEQVGQGEQVPVIAEGGGTGPHRLTEGSAVGPALVKIRLHPGVNGELTDGIAVEQLQQTVPLVGAGLANTGFDGHIDGHIGKDLVQKPLQPIRIS